MITTVNLSGNGTAGPITTNGGPVHVQLQNDIGGGSAAIQINLGEGMETDTTLTAVATKVLDMPQGSQVQVVLSGATSPDLNVIFTY